MILPFKRFGVLGAQGLHIGFINLSQKTRHCHPDGITGGRVSRGDSIYGATPIDLSRRDGIILGAMIDADPP